MDSTTKGLSGLEKKIRNLKVEKMKYWVLRTERKKNEEKYKKPEEPVRYHKADQHLHYGIPERE